MNKVIMNARAGLGNQFFQYAVGYATAKDLGCKLFIKNSSYKEGYLWNETCGYMLNYFIDDINYFENPKFLSLYNGGYFSKKIARKITKIYNFYYKLKYNAVFETPDKEFTYINFDKTKFDIYMDGYFQSYKYFEKYEQELVKLYQPKILCDDVKQFANYIKKHNNTVAIHYRNYSDINNGTKSVDLEFGRMDEHYYKQALKKISNIDKIFVFSNTINEAKNCIDKLNLNNVEYVNLNYKYEWEDMYLMSICNHNIIANSSYSWWAAYLNQNKNKIIVAPKSWGKLLLDSSGKIKKNDLFPPSWITI